MYINLYTIVMGHFNGFVFIFDLVPSNLLD